MAVEDRVVIHVEIDVDGVSDIAKVTAATKALEAQTNRLNRQTDLMNRGLAKATRATTGFQQRLKSVGNAFASLFRITNKFNFIGMAADIGLVALALGTVKLALVAGRFAVKAYQIALQGLGVAAAGVAGAIGTVTAALNEFQQVSLYPFLGSFRASATAVRGVLGDELLSFFGYEGLTGAVENLAKSGEIAASSFPRILRGLGDFARDGKQLAQLAEIFSTITQEGKVTSATLSSLTAINPVFASALAEIASGRVLKGEAANEIAAQSAEAGKISAEEFTKVFSGELESTNLWEGQLERLNNTLLGQIKGMMIRVGALFVDLGKPFLEPFREAIAQVELITNNTITRLRSVVTQFGLESFLPGLVGTFETLADFVVRMANEGLPKLIGIMDRVRGFFDAMENFFRNVGAVLGPLEKGADAMATVFGPFLRGIFGARGIGGLIMEAATGFADNADAMERMGKALGDLAFSFMGIFRDLQDSFFSGADTITEFFTVLTVDVMPVVREMLDLFRTLWREGLPVINQLLREASQIILPILQALNKLLGSIGPIGAAALFGLAGARAGGLSGPIAAGAGFGGAAGGLPGALAGGIGAYFLPRVLGRRRGGRHLAAAGRGRHLGGLAGMGTGLLGGASLATFAGLGVGGYLGGGYAARHGWLGGNTAAIGVAGGGLGALAGGALAGTAIMPGVGTVVGAVVGGIIAGIGAALGAAGVNSTREAANKWINEQIEAVTGTIQRNFDKGLNQTAIDDARAGLAEFFDPTNLASMAKDLGKSEDEVRELLEKNTEHIERELDMREFRLERNVDFITGQFDIVKDELLDLADVMAVDLTDSIDTLGRDLVELGILLGPDEIGAAVQAIAEASTLETLRGPGSVIGGAIAASEAASMREELNAMVDAFEASPTAQGLDDILSLGMNIAQIEYGETGIHLLYRLEDLLIQLSDPRSPGYAGEEGGALARRALTEDIQGDIAMVEGGTHAMYGPLRDWIAVINEMTPEAGFGDWETFFNEEFIPVVESLGGFEEAPLQTIIEGFATDLATVGTGIAEEGKAFATTLQEGTVFLGSKLVSSAIESAAQLKLGAIQARNILEQRIDYPSNTPSSPSTPSTPSTPPVDNFTRYDPRATRGDTATSRFQRTMGFHSALASRLGGNFRITSGMRNYKLGSLSSDHLTGRAIDLVGNNLGQYANAVMGAGGFAEFHGSGRSRHLHAVPPIGDTMAPVNLGKGQGTMMNVQFNITGSDDPEMVADAVMMRIEKLMRDEEERY